MSFSRPRLSLLATALWFVLPIFASAHPIPDIPVRSSFEKGGACTIAVEVDPRCFDGSPATAPSVLNAAFKGMSAEGKAELQKLADALVKQCIEFFFEPLGQVQPQFSFEFTSHNGAPLTADDQVVVLTGAWKTTVPSGITGWRIRSTAASTLAVVFQNSIDGQTHPRLAVLFPKETSFTLDLTELTGVRPSAAAAGSVDARGASGDMWSTGVSFLKQGFVHVLPYGLDHILFVLGLFLLSRSWRPLLAQITTFTFAHSVTLALATLGMVHVPAQVVEPVIAASIAAVAVENIVRPRYSPWRLAIVFGFGLIHGLGFASALRELSLPTGSMAVGLIGFNLGVEAGQITVVTLATLATVWLRDPQRYRRWVVVPASTAIALLGIWWTVQRILGGA